MAFFDFDLQNKLKGYSFGAYLRRSSEDSEDKQVRSIEGQQLDLEEVVNKLGLKVKWYPPESQSAFKEGRPIFNQIIEDVENGIVNAELVWHANRIARNYGDGGKFVQLMSDNKLKIVVTPHGVFENTPRDQEYLMNEFTRATRDSGDKSEAVKRGNRTKLKVGHVPSGRLSEGYTHVKNQKEESINVSDPERFPLLQKAVRLVLDQTHTPMEALFILNNDWGYRTKKTKRTGGKPLSKSTWYKILSDTKYYGELTRKEGTFHTDFPKLLEKEDFEKIQIILGNKSSRRQTKKDWAYTGLGIICASCNGTVIMEEKWQIICSECKEKFAKSKDRTSCLYCNTPISIMRNPKILHYTWLRGNHKPMPDGSKCTQPSLPVKDFEQQIDKLLSKFTIPQEFSEWAIKWLQNEHVVEVEDRSTIKNNLQRLDTEVQKKIDDLLDMRLRNLITDEEYQRKKEPLLDEQKHVRSRLTNTDKRADDWHELSEKTFNFATYAQYWFANGTTQQKREILSTIGSNLMIKDKNLLLYQRKPFTLIGQMQEKIEILLELFEPEDLLDKSSYSDTSNPVVPSLLGIRDSNPNKQIQNLLSYH